MLDRIIKISSISSGILIFLGFFKQTLYYNEFNVKIIEYLSLSEIITSFLDDMNILFMYLCVMTAISFMYMKYASAKTNLSMEALINEVLKVVYPFRYRYSIGFFFLVFFINILYFFDLINYNYFSIYFIAFAVIQGLTYFFLTKHEDEFEITNFSLIASSAFAVILAIFYFSKHDIEQTSNPKNEIIIKLEDRDIVCGVDSKLYVGKTQYYTFVFDSNSKTTEVIPNEQIIFTSIAQIK